MHRRRSPSRLVVLWIALLAVLGLAGGCASPGTRIDDDLDAFTNGINAILTAGMPLKQARAAVRERFPEPESDIESAPLVATRGNPIQVRRFMMVWSTHTPGTKLVLTMECDREMRVARWSTGPLYTQR